MSYHRYLLMKTFRFYLTSLETCLLCSSAGQLLIIIKYETFQNVTFVI